MIGQGKIGKANQKANRLLKTLFLAKGITTCELRYTGCTRDSFLGFAHRHKRIYYRNQLDKLSDYSQVILACTNCHNKIEYDEELTQIAFERLRGAEI